MELNTQYHESLLDGDGSYRSALGASRRWKMVAALSCTALAGVSIMAVGMVQERAALHAQLLEVREAKLTPAAAPASLVTTPGHCTAAGLDIFGNAAGKALPCCKGLVTVNAPCREGEVCEFCVPKSAPGNACTLPGYDVHDNHVGVPLKCCPGAFPVDTPCRGSDTCQYCQPPAVVGCTPSGKDVWENPTGDKQPCCPGLVQTTGKCRGDDVCHFCIPDVRTDGPRATYEPAKISVDPATPQEAVDKHKAEGMSLIWSDEFKDLGRTKAMFVFEDIPYGVPGNTGDVNIASIYTSDSVSLIEGGGLRLSCFMDPVDEKKFMAGWNGTWNTNYRSDVSLWTWHAPKVTSRLNGRFQYGMIETRLKAPKGYGPWPAAWLNGCYGFIAEGSGEFLLQDDYPFLCGQFWPPELDFFEHFSPEHTWFWRPNSMSLHSPNQYVGTGKPLTQQGGYCPTTLSPPGEAWCFGVSGAGRFPEDPTEKYIDYAMKWDPDGVDYYMDNVFMHRFTTDQMVMYLSGQNRPVLIPEMPMFMTYNIALVRKGMDLSHGGQGLTHEENFDPDTGAWKPMEMDVAYLRVYQDDAQGETRGLNPPITYQTRRKLLANRVTCNLLPELRCMVKTAGDDTNQAALAKKACDKLKELGDPYCDYIPKLCSLNNAGNPEGAYGLNNVSIAQFANQRLSLQYGACCVEEDKSALECGDDAGCIKAVAKTAKDKPVCRDTPKTKLPQWLLDSEYFQDPKLMYAEEGYSDGLAGTNPAGWKTYGMGLPRPSPPPPFSPDEAPRPPPPSPSPLPEDE